MDRTLPQEVVEEDHRLERARDAALRGRSKIRVRRINLLLKNRDTCQREIASELREEFDAVGRKRWLEWCEKYWGWKRSAAYYHLNPETQEPKRAIDRARHERERKLSRPRRVDNEPEASGPEAFTPSEEWQAREAQIRVEQQDEDQREAEFQDLATSIITVGFRELSKKAHPDTGGSHEAQTKLASARDEALRRVQQRAGIFELFMRSAAGDERP